MTSKVINPRKEAPATVYDDLFANSAGYNEHYKRSFYFPLMRQALERVVGSGREKFLEVGCGSGAFANYFIDSTEAGYHGFDFSPVAVEKAGARLSRNGLFYVGDARDRESYDQYEYDAIVCMEVLEHIEADRQVVGNWKPGTYCICSVPNFDYETHVRLFRDEEQVRARYGDLIDIAEITRVPRPLFLGRSFNEYLRKLRWSRNDPKKFLAHLGYKTFDNLAGWFVFSGVRTDKSADS